MLIVPLSAAEPQNFLPLATNLALRLPATELGVAAELVAFVVAVGDLVEEAVTTEVLVTLAVEMTAFVDDGVRMAVVVPATLLVVAPEAEPGTHCKPEG
jgi:hypothetical protein